MQLSTLLKLSSVCVFAGFAKSITAGSMSLLGGVAPGSKAVGLMPILTYKIDQYILMIWCKLDLDQEQI